MSEEKSNILEYLLIKIILINTIIIYNNYY